MLQHSHSSAFTYRAVWISDLRLGNRRCQAQRLLTFLQAMRCDTLYLLGSVVDFDSLERRAYWPQSHADVLRAIADKARSGCRVVYVPGTQEAEVLDRGALDSAGIEVCTQTVHQTRGGWRLWVTHGDQFADALSLTHFAALLGPLGDAGWARLDRWYQQARRWLGLSPRSLSVGPQQQDQAFAQAVLHQARRQGWMGVLCGGAHRPGLLQGQDGLYGNVGDWSHSCNVIVEREDGRLGLLRVAPPWQSPVDAVAVAQPVAA